MKQASAVVERLEQDAARGASRYTVRYCGLSTQRSASPLRTSWQLSRASLAAVNGMEPQAKKRKRKKRQNVNTQPVKLSAAQPRTARNAAVRNGQSMYAARRAGRSCSKMASHPVVEHHVASDAALTPIAAASWGRVRLKPRSRHAWSAADGAEAWTTLKLASNVNESMTTVKCRMHQALWLAPIVDGRDEADTCTRTACHSREFARQL